MRRSRTISNPQTWLLIAYLAFILSLLNISNFSESRVYGHDFVPNESASFLSFVNQLQTESDLVQSNLDNSNLTLAKQHANRAIELLNLKDPLNNVAWRVEIAERNQRVANDLVTAVSSLENITVSSSSFPEQQQSASRLMDEIDGIIEEAITTRIDRDQRVNATVQATALGDIINTLLRYYGNAYEVGFDMGNMSEMVSMMENSSNSNYTLVNVADYQSAQALSAKAQEIFNNELKVMASNKSSAFVTNLENGLARLNSLIKNKASPMDIMMIVHTQIHPNLLEAFNLKLR